MKREVAGSNGMRSLTNRSPLSDAGGTKHARADLGAALSQFETSGHVSLDAVAWLVTARTGA